MKVTQAILVFSLSLILLSCHNDDNDNNNRLDFSALGLKQTQWKGTFLRELNERKSTESAGIIFYSDNKGLYSVQGAEYNFEYSIDGKMLKIKDTGDVIGDFDGYWLLIQSDKNKMVLTNGTGDENDGKATLNLTRNY
jgi:hypothetical protein